MHRRVEDGEIRETFRTLRPKDGPKPLRAFAFLEVEGEEEPEEKVDLAKLESAILIRLILRSACSPRLEGRAASPFETHRHSASETRANALMAMLLRVRPIEVHFARLWPRYIGRLV